MVQASLKPYVVAGAGAKFYNGVEPLSARPLAEFGSFRDGIDTRALVGCGGGVQWRLASHWALRVDVRDYTTPFPTTVIVPAAGSNLGGWFHDLVATAGVTLRWSLAR